MVDEKEVSRPHQFRYCSIAVALTLVIFGGLYSIAQEGAVVFFAGSISLTGIPFWLILRKQENFQSSVARLWSIHAWVNVGAFACALIMAANASASVNFFAVCFGLALVVFHIGLLLKATSIARQRREFVDFFSLAALYLCPLLLAIGILYFDT